MDVGSPTAHKWWYKPPAQVKPEDVKRLPENAKFEVSAETQAETRRRLAEAEARIAEHQARMKYREDSILFDSIVEPHPFQQVNVAQLDPEDTKTALNITEDYILRGGTTNGGFFATNGDQTTTSIKEFLSWLRLHEAEFNGDIDVPEA